MPSSPYNFTTTATNYIKLKGGNLREVPGGWNNPPYAGPTYWQFTFTNWATVFPNWIIPQINNYVIRGVNLVRQIGAIEGVLNGAYTQAYYEGCYSQLIAACRANGIMLSLSGNGLNSYYNGYTDEEWRTAGWAAIQSLIENVLTPNQDVIAYLEAGQQETTSDADSVALSLYLAAQAKSVTTIPILISTNNPATFPPFAASSSVDLIGYHYYPTLVDPMDELRDIAGILPLASGKPIFIEETMVPNQSAGNTEAHVGSIFGATYSHPDCAGVSLWTGPDDTPGNDWSIYGHVADAPDYNSIWPDALASIKFASYSTRSQNLSFDLNSASGTLSGTLQLTLITHETIDPTESTTNIPTHLNNAYPAFLSGTIAATGPGSLSLEATVGSTSTTIGTAAVSETQSGFSISGTAPSGSVLFSVTASGGASFTNLASTLAIGSAPPILVQKTAPRLRPALNPPLVRRLAPVLR